MIMFFSGGGGSRNFNPESVLKDGSVMLSYILNVNQKKNKPDNRFKDILKAKRRKNAGKKGKDAQRS